jgi:heterodisulfide reductase subunit D
MPELAAIAQETRAWACYDCGKCTAICPLTRFGAQYSPRRHVLATNLGRRPDVSSEGTLFDCLTCKMCDSRCPVGVEYTELVQKLRELAHREGTEVECPHGGALQSAMRIMAKGEMKQDRLAWLDDSLKTKTDKGEVFYWTGCTMYYDAFFPEFEMQTLEGTKAAIRLLNKAGVEPVVSSQERCCGHDLLWNGDLKSYELLAKHNVNLVEESGAKTLVVSCAECLRTWKRDYEPYFIGKMPQVVHLTEFLAPHLGKLEFTENGGQKVTFHDPCRLGRHLDIYDAPRDAMEAVPGVELIEMGRSRGRALCCAGATWSNCDRYAKRIQVSRLREARHTKADVMVTACPKCQVHYKCAMQDPNLKDEIEIEMRDVAEILASGLA